MTSGRNDEEPTFAATFYPGGQDSFMMPELISPAPQRVMPEVPSNMQHGVATLEMEADSVYRSNSVVSPVHQDYGSRGVYDQTPAPPGAYPQQSYNNGYQQHDQGYQNQYDHNPPPAHAPPALPVRSSSMHTGPLPSPFPPLINPGPNVPPSDEQKEEDLEHSRMPVLNSNDPERQLNWAQAALVWADNAIQARIRAAVGRNSRPMTPNSERTIRTDAIQVVNFLADQGHPKAEFLRSMWYEFGKFGYPEDTREAFAGYRRAAEKGYGRAEYRMGTKYESTKDVPNALKHYQNGVNMQDAASYYRMGMMSLLGQNGQPQNYEKGLSMIKFSADNADENAAQGAYVYGMLLSRELPNITLPEFVLPYDVNQAKHYLERAAFLGYGKAQLKMGSAYELCLLGCDFNPTLSLHYNRLAANQGEAEAEMAISKWFLCGYEGVFMKNEDLAFEYAKRAAQQEFPTAEFALGYFYELGLHCPMDLGRAREWYQKAADHGNADAPGRLKALSMQRTLSRKDHEDVAINRIKSQYGSRRGKRPDHLVKKAVPTTMPVMEEGGSPVNGTFPPRSSSAAPVQPPFRVVTPVPSEQPPFRVVTPQPEGHARGSFDPYARNHYRSPSGGYLLTSYPGQTGQQLPMRPKSAAPYPEEMRPQDLRPRPPADRPNSAFGIKPLHDNHSLAPKQGQRPVSAAPPGQLPVGRGQQLPYRGQTPTVPDVQKRDERPTTKDWERQYRLPYKPEAAPPGQQGRNKLQKDLPAQPNRAGPSAPGQQDPRRPSPIQTTATYPDGSSRPTLDARSSSMSAGPLPNGRASSMLNDPYRQPQSAVGRKPVQQFDNLHPQRPSTSHADSAPVQRPSSSQGLAPNAFPERRSSMMPNAAAAASTPTVMVSPAAPAKPPPKKGPQTFEEMGVPQAPKESDCLVM